MSRAALLLAIAVGAAACSASAFDEDPSGRGDAVAASDDLAKTSEAMFGRDRVGALLAGHTERIPTTFAEVEVLFGVGRACTRSDSKEIFVVEESRSRTPGGEITPEGPLLPRTVISGCNTGDLGNPSSVARSTSLFVALVSDPDLAGATGGDSILTEPVEVMARDEQTGSYNFYVFAKDERGTPAVTRIYRHAETDAVLERTVVAGGRASLPVPPANASKRCFACHVNGAPLMNEMRDPWTNWISFKRTLPVSQLAGNTKALVSEALPSPSTGRSSLANDLEPIMRSAIRAHVSGDWARQTLARPEGHARLLASLFCETELNYATATDAVPIETFIDPDLNNGDLVAPDAFDETPTLMPIRSEFDRAVEGWLIDRGFVSHEVALAVRLFDDENDIFSDARCALKEGTVSAIGEAREAPAVQERLRSALVEAADAVAWKGLHPKRHAYLRALLEAPPSPSRVDEAFAAYAVELAARFEVMKGDPERVAARDQMRKARARAMFPGASTPLPLLR